MRPARAAVLAPVALAFAAALAPARAHADVDVVFSSANRRDDTYVCADRLIAEARRARSSIRVMVAHLDSARIAEALIAIHEERNRNRSEEDDLDIRVLVDEGEYASEVSAVRSLERAGIQVRYKFYSMSFFYPQAKLMHHKVLIVDDAVLCCGSYNWSDTAEHLNFENMTVLSGDECRATTARYTEQFERLWELGRDVYPQFRRALRARPGEPGYRRYVPLHFISMTLTRAEIQPIRSVAARLGLFADRTMLEHMFVDRETRQVVDQAPGPPFIELGGVMISEVHYRVRRRASGQFIELHNSSPFRVDLTGWAISDEGSRDALVAYPPREGEAPPLLLPPGGYALIVDPDRADEDFALPRGVLLLTVTDRAIGNGLGREDVIVLLGADGREVDRTPPLPDVPVGTSVERDPSRPAGLAADFGPCPASEGATAGRENAYRGEGRER